MSSLPPVLVSHSITVNPGHTVINLVFNEAIERGTGTIIVTDGALQTVINRSTGLPSTRVVGATDTREISLDLVGIDGNTASINADGLAPGHHYRVFILPGALQYNGMPFAGVSNGNVLTFNAGPAPDTTAPGLVGWALDNTAFSSSHASAQLTLTFSEAVAQFSSGAFTATGLTFGTPASSDGIHWTVAVTAQSGIDVSNPNISLDLSRVKDLAGNPSTGFSTLPYNIDTKPPTVTAFTLSDNRISHTGSVEVTVKFSETVKSFPASAFTVPNAQISDVLTTTDGGITWKGTLTTNANINAINNVLKLDMSKVQDLAGNSASGLVQADKSYDVDVTPPTATMSLTNTHLTTTAGATLTIQFSEPVATPSLSWFTKQNVDLTNLVKASADGSVWTATVTASATGTTTGNQISLDMGQVHDLAGNAGSGSVATASFDVDGSTSNTTLPTTTSIILGDDTGFSAYYPERASDFITSDPGIALHGVLSSTLTGSQTVDLTIGSQHVTPQISGNSWYYYLPTTAPTLADNTYTVSARVVDGSSTGAAYSKTLVVDTKAPAITSTVGATHDVNDDLVITFDEPVSWHGIADLSGDSASDIHTDTAPWRNEDNFVKLVHDGLTEWVYIDNRNLSNGGRTLTISANDLHLFTGKNYTLELRQSGADYVSLTDTAGNYLTYSKFSFASTGTRTDTDAPKALAAYATRLGYFGIGEQIDIQVMFSEAVTGGNQWPELTLSNGGKATYQYSSSDGRMMDFRYTVSAADASGTLDLNGMGTMLDNVVDIKGNKLAAGTLHLSTLINPSWGSIVYVDTSTPPTIASAPLLDSAADSATKGDGITNASSLSFHGAGATAGMAVTLYDLSAETSLGSATANSDGSWNITLDSAIHLSEGSHDLAVGQSNMHGNPSAALSPSFKLVVDKTAPNALAGITLDPGSDGGTLGDWITAVTAPTITGTGEAGAKVEIVDGSKSWTVTVGTDGTWATTLSSLATGLHKLTLHQTDAAGNVSADVSKDLTIDPAAVIVTAVAPPPKLASPALAADSGSSGTDGIINLAKPTFKGTGAVANATIELTDGKGYVLSGHADASGNWSLTPSTDLAEGNYSFTVRQTDSGNHVSAYSDPLSVTIDVTAPSKLSAPVLAAASDKGVSNSDGLTNVTKPEFTGTGAEGGATIQLWEGSTMLKSGTADVNGAWSITLSSDLAEGAHAIKAVQVDAAGNTSAASNATNITIDITAPTVADWTSTVHIGQQFQFWFSEAVVHTNASTLANIYDNVTAALMHISTGSASNWTDNVNHNGITTSSFTFTPINSGWVELAFTGVEDLAGNAMTADSLAHYAFTVDLSGTSFFVPVPVL